MSASPSKTASAASSVTPNGSQPQFRKKAPVSIFTQKKKPTKKPPPASSTSAPTRTAPTTNQQQVAPPTINGSNTINAAPAADKDYTDYPIFVSKNSLMQGLHYHAIKFSSRQDKDGNLIQVNPYDEFQFLRPVHLHRRSTRDKIETAEQSDAASGVEDKEKELMSIRRAERQAEREANQALIAPTGGESKKATRQKPKKRVEEVYRNENDPRQMAKSKLRYEEARPWHLEDFNKKNVWVGSYEEPMTESSVMFEIDRNGFKMVPVEKWYRFTQTNKVNAMDSDQVEKYMAKKFKAPRWFLGTQEVADRARREAAMARRGPVQEQMQARRRNYDDDEGRSFAARDEYQADVDEIDFEFNDEFQDDDEGARYGEYEDDDTKEIDRRIREEMRGANLAGTGVKDEDKDYEEEEIAEKRKEREQRKLAKRTRKKILKKEQRAEYDTDSERGEFSESSETEDSEEERERLEEEKKQEEARKVNGDKSGASSRGTNTPSGRPEKRDVSKSLGASLKRPGSPDLSEMSGNESSRKKAKGVNGRPMPSGARSLSPDAAKPKRTNTDGQGSGSDTDTSRSSRPKIKLKNTPPGSPHDKSPTGSRAASPSGTGSRAQSPARRNLTFPNLDEVRAAIPPEGIDLKGISSLFRARVLGRLGDFTKMVKEAGKQDPVTKLIMPREVHESP